MSMGHWWSDTGRHTRSITCPSAILSTKNPTRTGLGPNQRLSDVFELFYPPKDSTSDPVIHLQNMTIPVLAAKKSCYVLITIFCGVFMAVS